MDSKMNERIQTLLAKFKETESTHRGDAVLIGFDEIEKFTELIVKECAAIDFYKRTGISLKDNYGVTKTILEHFGVEE
jgi:hypothetical protein